jgi:hypothetical protein
MIRAKPRTPAAWEIAAPYFAVQVAGAGRPATVAHPRLGWARWLLAAGLALIACKAPLGAEPPSLWTVVRNLVMQTDPTADPGDHTAAPTGSPGDSPGH